MNDTNKSSPISSDLLCPLTLQALPKENPTNVGVIFSTHCLTKSQVKNFAETLPLLNRNTTAQDETTTDETKDILLMEPSPSSDSNQHLLCRCALISLTEYVQNTSDTTRISGGRSSSIGSGLTCPVCQSHSITSIWDFAALQSVVIKLKEDPSCNNLELTPWNIVTFRYGKQCFYLSTGDNVNEIHSARKSGEVSEQYLAQDRIAKVLGIDVDLGMKVGYKFTQVILFRIQIGLFSNRFYWLKNKIESYSIGKSCTVPNSNIFFFLN